MDSVYIAQYIAIDTFEPQYDADGNQTLIKTSTGTWSVTYNAENRPVRWECGDTVVTMDFDRMGRRVFYKKEVAGVVTKHHKFVYDNYLCIQKVDALNSNAQINLFVWDPTEPVATRPLFTQRGTGYKFFYTHDGNKNVSELVHFEQRNGIAAHYDYAPFGAVTRAISASAVTDNTFTTDNPFRFSSEYHDDTLGLVYYNYRHYNPSDARWCGRDPLEEHIATNLYWMLRNNCMNQADYLGYFGFADLLAPFKVAADVAGAFTAKILEDAQKAIYSVYTSAKEQALALYELSVMVVQKSIEKLSELGGPCGSGVTSILVPEKLPVLDVANSSEVQFTIKMVDFSICCTNHDICYEDGCKTTRNCNNKIRYAVKQNCDDELGECMSQQLGKVVDNNLLDDIQGFIYSSIYEFAVEQFGKSAYDNACD